nr:MAG TPA_asm: hypothetical protein [Caudoviricetes sp.]
MSVINGNNLLFSRLCLFIIAITLRSRLCIFIPLSIWVCKCYTVSSKVIY